MQGWQRKAANVTEQDLGTLTREIFSCLLCEWAQDWMGSRDQVRVGLAA